MRGIVIAGTHSGSGKTTVTLGVMAALRRKGLAVQPFKCGPDFIDAGLHRLAAGQASRNLDIWMCGPEYVKECFVTHGSKADISVIEGVMGLYDGDRSTASLAALLGAPVVLVVDAYGMAESAGAMVQGYREFGRNSERGLEFAGVIFNRVASESHFARLKKSVRDAPVLGYLPRDLDFEIPHRHLGLATAEEHPFSGENLEKLAGAVLACIDIDKLLPLAATGLSSMAAVADRRYTARIPHAALRIAVARDKAFCFYYEDNLDMLRAAGAEILPFSPIADAALPEADALYIGGGYPELHAGALSKNVAMRNAVRDWAEAGKPVYAECGGLMYLSEGIHDLDGRLHDMAGVFPFETLMTKKPRLGYRSVRLDADSIVGKAGAVLRGHEFHYSQLGESRKQPGAEMIYSLRDGQDREKGPEGFRYRNALASYVHVHFGSNPAIADHMIGFIKGEPVA